MNEQRFISEPVEIRAIEKDGQTTEYIAGRGIVFNKWSQVLTAKRSDGTYFQFVEKIEPRAIEGVDLANVVSMVNHKITLGKRSKGTMEIEIKEDGVHYLTAIPNTTDGQNARENVRNGNLEGSSFQFSIPTNGDVWDKSTTPYQRTITKFSKVTEMGPVEYPAYQDTSAALRSFDSIEEIQEVKQYDFSRAKRQLQILELQNK